MQKPVCPAFKSSSAHFFHCKYSTKPRGPHAVPASVPSHHAHQLKSQILTGMLAMRRDAHPASSILGSAAPVAPISPPAPSRHGYGHGQDRINPRRVQEQPRHPATGWVWGPRNFPTHLNWPRGLNSRSWLPVRTRFNFLIGISWKSCTFLISRPSMSAPL